MTFKVRVRLPGYISMLHLSSQQCRWYNSQCFYNSVSVSEIFTKNVNSETNLVTCQAAITYNKIINDRMVSVLVLASEILLV